jgi:hypothetical protein
MDGLRWEDYVLASGNQAVSKLWSAALELERRVTFVLGVGFDPRALVALQLLLTQAGNQVVRVVRLGLPAVEDDDLSRKLTQANDCSLRELVAAGIVEVTSIAYPEGVESQAAGLRMSWQIQSNGVIGEKDLVVVDVSGLPSTVYFPVIGGLLRASDEQGLQRDLQVVVCENPELDRIILEEGVASPGSIRGFGQRLDPDGSSGVTRVWVPVLGEHQEPYIRSIYEFLAPNEVCPVLPFPARNPRRGDDLLLELRRLIFDTIEVEPRNFIYADERNPFDLYRGLCRLNDRYTKALVPLGLGSVTVVTSVHGSKVMSVGALLAAYENNLSVVSAGPTGYRIQPSVEIEEVTAGGHLTCLWLDGEPYR